MRVVAPELIADDLVTRGWDWLEVVPWDGEGRVSAEARCVDPWAPPYGVAPPAEVVRETLAAMRGLTLVRLQARTPIEAAPLLTRWL